MKFNELLENAIVKDDDIIKVFCFLGGTKKQITSGNWYQDQILDFTGYNIASMEYDKRLDDRGFWQITLEDD